MSAKHTPGPWSIEHKADGGFTYAPRIHVGPAHIYYSAGYHAEFKARAEADARLIAAAPDLLGVAQSILTDDMLQYLPAEYIARVRAAIARATGGES